MKLTPEHKARIFARCIEEGECLLWPGAMADGTSPQIRVKGKTYTIRRLLWEENHDPVPKGWNVAVTCGNPNCLAHYEAQPFSKIHKRVAQLAGYGGPAHAAKIAAGRRRNSKATTEIARAIRGSDEPSTVLSERFGLSHSYTASIKRGRQFKDYSNPFAGLGAMTGR